MYYLSISTSFKGKQNKIQASIYFVLFMLVNRIII